MSDSFPENADLDVPDRPATRVKIIGVGGGGVNTVERLMSGGLLCSEAVQFAEFAAVNTDTQSLATSPVPERLAIGRTLTRGLGAGGEAELGRSAAEADRPAVDALVQGNWIAIAHFADEKAAGTYAEAVLKELKNLFRYGT